MPAHIHLKIVDVAKEMAHQLYNTMMEDNVWYGDWKKANPDCNAKRLEEKFVIKTWPRMVGQARATLAGMLKENYPDSMKEEIFEALLLDDSLKLGRTRLAPGTNILQ